MPTLVLVGAGHAHLHLLTLLPALNSQGIAVKVVHPSEWLYYPGMLPGYIAGTYALDQMRINVASLVSGAGCTAVEHIAEYAEYINVAERRVRLRSGRVLDYDVLSCNIGSVTDTHTIDRVESAAIGSTIFMAKPVLGCLPMRDALLRAMKTTGKVHCVVVGGGPGAHEIASNIWYLAAQHSLLQAIEIVLIRGERPFVGCTPRFRTQVDRSLHRKGINIVPKYAKDIGAKGVITKDGAGYAADYICVSTGVATPALFVNSGIPVGAGGAMRVNEYLQSLDSTHILGGGDCIEFSPPLDKVGVYAVRQMEVLSHNIQALLLKSSLPLNKFQPQKNYFFSLNVGQRRGIALKWNMVIKGRSAFWAKNYFDTLFIQKYQR